MKEVFVLLKRK